jgi:hypothetical protein
LPLGKHLRGKHGEIFAHFGHLRAAYDHDGEAVLLKVRLDAIYQAKCILQRVLELRMLVALLAASR